MKGLCKIASHRRWKCKTGKREKPFSKDARAITTADSVIYPYAMKGTGLKYRTVTQSKGEYARSTKSGTVNTNTIESAL